MNLRSIGVFLFALVVAGCGGGSGSSDDAVGSDEISIQGKVTDQNGNPVSGAEVGFAIAKGIYKAISGTSGKFDLRVPADASTALAYPALYVNKQGSRPAALVYDSFAGGQKYNGNVNLPALGVNESAPLLGYIVHHLGNDAYGGAQNSQFQRSSEGLSAALKIEDFDAKLSKGYTSVRISLLHKGIQTVGGCVSEVILFQTDTNGAIGANSLQQLRGSPEDGSYISDQYSFSLAGFVAGQTTFVAFRSNLSCSNTTDRYDDFELTNVLATFS